MSADQATPAPADGTLPKSAKRPQPKGGSRKGRPNKATAELRMVVKQLTEGLAPEVEQWIRRGAKRNPLAAANLVVTLLEFAVPKLQRTELTGANGEPLKVNLVKGL
jgi:hypothetical protein